MRQAILVHLQRLKKIKTREKPLKYRHSNSSKTIALISLFNYYDFKFIRGSIDIDYMCKKPFSPTEI